ncbi:MAG TPA: IclR family transcriptional regulator [Pseudolabrys sp.]|jgi:IclR family acetate operon transcriptional repressor|nr:IclR family transcriptional regulator [Pseudolabrys sp.]
MDAKVLPGPGAETRPVRAGADRHSIQSVDRALLLLETIAEAGGEATLTDLATRTGLNISTCHHLLATLIKRGFAAKVPGRRLYALGVRILYLGHACLQVDLPRRAQPHLEKINQATGETVHLAALQGDAVVTLAVREARHAVRVDTGKIGKIEAPHATSVGKAILAWLPEDEIRRIVGKSMKRFTEKTITEFPAFIESLRVVRRNGYAVDREEFLPGVICVGAAIRDQAGTVVGAISASTPAMRASEDHVALMRNEVVAAARALSAEFGEPGSQTNSPRALAI